MKSHATAQTDCSTRSIRAVQHTPPNRIIAFALLLLAAGATSAVTPDQANEIRFPARPARFVRVLIHASSQGEPCIDELEVFAASGTKNLALASGGAKASASSCLAGYAIHQTAHLNDGRYGNARSWIAAGRRDEWVQIELPQAAADGPLALGAHR